MIDQKQELAKKIVFKYDAIKYGNLIEHNVHNHFYKRVLLHFIEECIDTVYYPSHDLWPALSRVLVTFSREALLDAELYELVRDLEPFAAMEHGLEKIKYQSHV